MLGVIQIDSDGMPGALTEVDTHNDGIDLLMKLAAEQNVHVTREELDESLGFFVETDHRQNVSGCWLVASD